MAIPDVPYIAVVVSAHEAQLIHLRAETAHLRQTHRFMTAVVGALSLLGAALTLRLLLS